jgi:hypothetical protein
MDLREQKINQLVAEHNLPADIVRQCVDAVGTVNGPMLGVALQTKSLTQEGLATKDRAEVEGLKLQLKAAQEEIKQPGVDRMALAQRTIKIKDRIFALGGRL